jgi:hypothetical protein
MDWEIAGALGDLLGGIAVVISLAYLAIQLRTANRQNKSEAIYNMQIEQNKVSEVMASDERLVTILLKTSKSEDLSEIEEIQLAFFIARLAGVYVAIESYRANAYLDDQFYEDTKLQFKHFTGAYRIRDRVKRYVEANHPNTGKHGVFELLSRKGTT